MNKDLLKKFFHTRAPWERDRASFENPPKANVEANTGEIYNEWHKNTECTLEQTCDACQFAENGWCKRFNQAIDDNRE